ncbi:SDR family oxidoreductase [Methanophagales archaeon]|nr:MAG: SDR family oxidoreductase [Methanophagales archaeon]
MKVLVTGGAGFIGSHTVDALVKNGYEVAVVDNLSNGRKENINKDAKFYEIDVESEKLKRVFESERPDMAIHLAAQISLRKSVENPMFDARQNILGSINLLQCCKEFEVDKIVYASSVAVYGEPKYLPVDEKHATKPASPYGLSKLAAEEYIKLYHRMRGLDYVILRYANVYGPRQMSDGEAGVVAIFTDRMLHNKPPVVFGDGEQTRDFVYVEDVALANLLALKNGKNKVFNIGSGKETSVNDVFGKIRNILGINIRSIRAEPKQEIRRIYISNEKAVKELGWNPKTNIDDGLKKTVAWFKERQF